MKTNTPTISTHGTKYWHNEAGKLHQMAKKNIGSVAELTKKEFDILTFSKK